MKHAVSRSLRSFAFLIVAALVAIAVPAQHAAASEHGTWTVDAAHTEINFSINHFFTPVTGSFGSFEIDLAYDPESPEKSSVEARIEIGSIDTGNEQRDNHLRSGDWFEAEKHPHMTFKSTSVRKVGENELVATGPLTIKGQSREIELPITLLGTTPIPEEMQEMFGGTKKVASFKAGASIDRGDYGVGVGSWAATLVVGGQVDIQILLEAHKK